MKLPHAIEGIMNPLNLEIGLRGAGLILLGLVVANFFAVKWWRYADNLP